MASKATNIHTEQARGWPYRKQLQENVRSPQPEAFFRTLKKECIYRINFKSEAEFKRELDDYIAFYNNQREQHYLRYHSPVQFELQMA